MTAIYALVAALALVCLSPATATHQDHQPGIISMKTGCMVALWSKGMLEEKLNNTSIPEINGHLPALFSSKVVFNLSEIILREREPLDVDVNITESEGILMTVIAPMIQLEGNIRLDLESGFWLEDMGTTNFTATLRGVTLKLLRNLTPANENSELIWESSSATASIENLEIELHDETLNKILALITDSDIKNFVVDLLTEPSFYNSLATFKYDLIYNITNELYLNLTVLREPTTKNGMIVLEHSGEVRHLEDREEIKTQPRDFGDLTLRNHQAIRFSDFTFNSLGEVLHKHQLLSYKYSAEDLPQENKELLNMDGSDECFGKLFPKAKERFPGSTVVLSVNTTKPLGVEIIPEGFKGHSEFMITANALKRDASVDHLFTVRMSIVVPVNLTVKSNRILFKLVRPAESTISVDKSSIGEIPTDDLRVVIHQSFKKVIMPIVARLSLHGLSIPYHDHLNVSRYEFDLKDGYMDLLMDVTDAKEIKPELSPKIDS